jgi:hypothetical protein
MLKGGCYCGLIRYEIEGKPDHLTNCHCSICRRTTGAPFVTWFNVLRSEFKFVQGVPTQFNSSKNAIRTFCPNCGTHLTFLDAEDPLNIDITSCSLDDPELCPPEDHTYCENKLGWMTLADNLPRYSKSRSAGKA